MRRLLILLMAWTSCSKDSVVQPTAQPEKRIVAVDLSSYHQVKRASLTFIGRNDSIIDPIVQLKKSGVNTVRLRLFHSPSNGASGWSEVLKDVTFFRGHGLGIWLTVHYSDTWADPGNQRIPLVWTGLPMKTVLDSVRTYTSSIVDAFQPNYIQIGNEINNGLLHPIGHRWNEPDQMIQVLKAGTSAVRDTDSTTAVVIHYSGKEGLDAFLTQINQIDCDLLGVSYYPKWHGKTMEEFMNRVSGAALKHQKPWVVAETAYPFTLEWADLTHNLIGDSTALIPHFPARPHGQLDFMIALDSLVKQNNGEGWCYWEPLWVALDGPNSTHGSPWENQAWFDFNLRQLPVVKSW